MPHNERGAGRKPKYEGKTVQVGFKVPEKHKEEFKAYAYKFLDKLAIRKHEGVETKCDCYIDESGIFRRGKSKPKCTLSKGQHKF